MGLRQGDRLTLSRNATLWLGQYDSLKPHVTLTRELGADPEADREDMEAFLYVELRRAVLFEVRNRRALNKHIPEDGRVTQLIRHCEEVVLHGEEAKPARNRAAWPRAEEDDEEEVDGKDRQPRRRKKGTRRKKASRRKRS